MSKRQGKLTQKQKELLWILPVGQKETVATSEYSIGSHHPASRGYSPDWNPITYAAASTIRSLIGKGYLIGELYWRGANVTRTDKPLPQSIEEDAT